jgi:hypothetical protein
MRAAFWDGPKTGTPTEVDETLGIYPLGVMLAFAKVRFNAIDEGLFRTGYHKINLIKIRMNRAEETWSQVAPRFPLRT